MDYTSCFEDDNDYGEYDDYYDNEDEETDSEAERETKIEKRDDEHTRAFWKEIYDENERTREAWGNPLYPTMVNLALTMINKKNRLLYEQFSNEDEDKDRRLYNYVYDSDMYYKLGCTDKNIRYDTTQYIKLLLNYNKYNKLHILKDKTKLNNDIIFNIIIKYMP